MANMIRNISQTAAEREIVKLAPDIIVYIEGLPYLRNRFINDRKTNKSPALVNFNDHVTAFSCSYDTDVMIPNGSLVLQVPNHLKFQYQMPGGNNLIQPMMQVQVYAKAYFMSAEADTIYRRVFKGLVSHVGYNDNGKTLEISIQCYGSLYMLQLMQINVSPSLQTAAQTGSAATFYSTKLAMLNPYKQIAAAFVYGLSTDGFQLNNLTQVGAGRGSFGKAVELGYISKWQAILSNLAKDIHIFGASWKDNPTRKSSKTQQSAKKGTADQDTKAHISTIQTTTSESDEQNDMYYGQIREYLPDRAVADVSLLNNQIISRIELIRKMVHMIDFEAYQDIDGKIIVKPPLYNLDVVNIGTRAPQTSTTPNTTGTPASRNNSYANPLTAITPETNPFVIHLSEILTEQESEDQAAIRRTRTVVSGNVDVKFQFAYNEEYLQTAEYIDVGKLIRFGLREEPVIYTPWLKNGNVSLFAHAVAETIRANRGYHVYTVTIPMRPELKLGFPVFFPHRDMYGYIKSINLGYQVGGTATMTIVCDSIRRRFLVNTTQSDPSLNQQEYYTSAPDMVLKWTKTPLNTQPSPGQSPQTDNTYVQQQSAGIIQGGNQPSSLNAKDSNLTNLVGVAITLPSPDTNPTDPAQKVDDVSKKKNRGHVGTQTDMANDTVVAQYFIQNDGDVNSGTVPPPVRTFTKKDANGNTETVHTLRQAPRDTYFKKPRLVTMEYFEDIKNGTMPFSDGKGYEVITPFPWGRYIDLNTAIKNFTEYGWITGVTAVDGTTPIVDPAETAILQGTDAFLYAGLGTPTAQKSAVDLLQQKFAQISNTVGGTFAPADPSKPNQTTLDATVMVLQYKSGSSNDSQLLHTAQPEDALIQDLVDRTQNAAQRLVDVLVSGTIAPTELAQEALLATQTQTPLNTTSVGSTPSQQAQQAKVFAGTPPSDSNAIGPTPTATPTGQ